MPCSFAIGGENFDAVAFLNETKLENVDVKFKGEKFSPRREPRPFSYVGGNASLAGFDDFDGQIRETVQYLENHRSQLSLIKTMPGITFATLNFGVHFDMKIYSKNGLKVYTWPEHLIRLAAELGFNLELSLYAVQEGSEAEEALGNRANE